jgi:starch synthase
MRELPQYALRFASAAAVVTIHNAGKGYHQEVWSAEFAGLLTGLTPAVLEKGLLGDAVDPLLLAGSYCLLCTVSEQYAKELLAEKQDETSGGFGKACRERGIPLAGITNGIDPTSWDPRSPQTSGLPFSFDPGNGDLAGKRKCRERLEERLGLPAHASNDQSPLYAFVGRLTAQKGVEVLFKSLKEILSRHDSPLFVVLGSGEKKNEDMFFELAENWRSKGRLCFISRYDPALARLIYAASDFFVIPSEYEPCGLTDFISQLFGSIPIVHRVGGLVKIRHGETGFSYDEQSPKALCTVLEETARIFVTDQKLLDTIRRRAFSEIFSHHTWDRVVEDSYLPLYVRAFRE